MLPLVYWSFLIALTPWALYFASHLFSAAASLGAWERSREVHEDALSLLDSAIIQASNSSGRLGWVGSFNDPMSRVERHHRIIQGLSARRSSPHRHP
jgi:hypothetical protein